jgi:hypothetical protein
MTSTRIRFTHRGSLFEEVRRGSAHTMRLIYVPALFFTLAAPAVHGQALRLSPSEAVTVLRSSHSPADLTDTALFVPERPEALWLLGPTSATPWTWPPEASTPVAPLSRQPYLAYGRGVHARGGHAGGAFGLCSPFSSSCGSSLTVGFDQESSAFLKTAPPLKAEAIGKGKGNGRGRRARTSETRRADRRSATPDRR